MKKIVIFGTGDIGQIANYYFEKDTELEVAAFTIDESYIKEDSFEGKPVVPFEKVELLYPPDKYSMFVALGYSGMNKNRERKYYEAKAKGFYLESYISSKCSFLTQFPCGDNCFIFEDNTIQPYVKIGNNVILWSGNHIGHHSIIEDHNFISSHVVVSGRCHIGSNCFLGVNSTIHNNVVLARETLVAAGAMITRATEANDVWVPVKSVKIERKSLEIDL